MKKRYSAHWKSIVIGTAVAMAATPVYAPQALATDQAISSTTVATYPLDPGDNLTITSSGHIEVTASATGLYVNDAYSGSITIDNGGSIGVQRSSAATAYGVYVNGNLSGSLTNNGAITASASSSRASAYGVYVNGDLSGSINNTGTITAAADASNSSAYAYGIYTGNLTDVGAHITNDGTINATATAHASSAYAYAYGIYTGSVAEGAYITNGGTITATANASDSAYYATAYGVDVEGDLNGSITNSGTITSTAYGNISGTANAQGIYVNGAVYGSITNSDEILAEAESTNYGAYAYGIYTGWLAGNGAYIENTVTGTITATANASNSNATAYGISTGSLNGEAAYISNSGSIEATATAFSQAYVYGIYTGELSGAGTYVENTATITAIANSINAYATAYGIYTGGLSGNGAHISNSGAIVAEATVTQNDGGAVAYGIYTGVAGEGVSLGENAYIENTATITATATANATTGTSLHATAYGIYLDGSLTGGGAHITNSGIIEATASADSQATAYGISVGNLAPTTAITNGGTITVQATSANNNASAYGIRTGDLATDTSITNEGIITVTANAASQANAYGIFVGSLDANATIANTGTITATANGTNGQAYAIYVNSGSGTITNSGTLNGKVELASSTLNLEGTVGRITGAVTGAAGSTVNVNGTFTAENIFTVEAFNVGAAGTLSVPAASGVPVTIHGNYTQAPGGVFQTYVSGPSNYGKLVVDGTANLPATTNIYVNVAGGAPLANGNVLSSVFSANTLNVGTLSVDDNSAMWNFIGTVNGNAIDLTTEQTLTFADAVSGAAVSPAAAGVASALDAIQEAGATGDMLAVLSEFNDLTEAEVAAAVTQLMPGFAGGSANIVQGLASSGGSRVVHEHMTGGGQGLSSGDPLFRDRMVWAQPFYSWTDQNERKGVSGYNADSYGLALGADGKVNEQWRIGAAFSLAKGDVEGDSPVTRNNLDINTYQITLYAADRLSEATSLNLQAGFGVNDNDSSRQIVFGGLNRIASADYTSWHTLLDAELEHRYKVSEKTSLASYLRAQYSYVTVEDYTETGAGAINLHMDDNSEDSLILSVGGKAAYALSEQVKLTGKLGAGYDLMANQSSVTATFAGGGPAFITEGLDPSSFVMQGGLGFEMLAANGLTVTARYDVDGREDYTNQVATINFRLPF